MSVCVLDKRKKPLMPCSEKRARLLLERGRARVHKMFPFTIRLVDRTVEESVLQPIRLKVDPGSATTGGCLNREAIGKPQEQTVLHLFELRHRGQKIHKDLGSRRRRRHGRRNRNLRYRAPRFNNRRRKEGWLAPSLEHRVLTTMSHVSRYRSIAPVTSVSVERVRFDMQALENPGISGVEYQQGTLFGYELREYILERDGRECAYCGRKGFPFEDRPGVPLNLDHVVASSNGGSDRPSNLICSCVRCNQRKGNKPVEVFLADRPEVLQAIKARLKKPLRDAAAVNATRWRLWEDLVRTGLPVEASSGGRTKLNRHVLGVPKGHALDAACTGEVSALRRWEVPLLAVRCCGRGRHARTVSDEDGFPRLRRPKVKAMYGFRTGDIVLAEVGKGKKAGRHLGRVAVRDTGRFNIQTLAGVVQGISWKLCKTLQRDDGYGYGLVKPRAAPIQPGNASRHSSRPLKGAGVLPRKL